MPSSSEHRAKAERNRKFLETLSDSSAPEWKAVVAFYTALHQIELLSARDNIHHGNHQDRLNYLNKSKEHRRIHANFSVLYDASQSARYDTVNQFEKAFPGHTVEEELIGKHLRSVEDHVISHCAWPPPPTSPAS